MATASRAVLSGFELRSDAKVIRHPASYSDPRGVRMFEVVNRLLNHLGTDGRPKQQPVASHATDSKISANS